MEKILAESVGSATVQDGPLEISTVLPKAYHLVCAHHSRVEGYRYRLFSVRLLGRFLIDVS
jgi:hypothetical protein